MNAQVGELEFVKDWYDENEEGLRGGWDAVTRDKELDADAVCGEVVFPGPDAVTGTMGAPFGAGFNPVATKSPGHLLAGARATAAQAQTNSSSPSGTARRSS